MQPSAMQHKRFLDRLIRVDQLVGETQLCAEFETGWFLRQKRIGSGFRHEIADTVGDNLPAPGRSGLEDCAAEGQTSRRRLFLDGECGREAGDASTDDDHCAGIAHD